MPQAEIKDNPLNVLIIMGISIEALHNLRQRFPALHFVVPGEDTDSDGRYRIAEAAPSDAELSQADVIVGWQISPAQLDRAIGRCARQVQGDRHGVLPA